jgi:hypothetical protein
VKIVHETRVVDNSRIVNVTEPYFYGCLKRHHSPPNHILTYEAQFDPLRIDHPSSQPIPPPIDRFFDTILTRNGIRGGGMERDRAGIRLRFSSGLPHSGYAHVFSAPKPVCCIRYSYHIFHGGTFHLDERTEAIYEYFG